MATTAMDKIIAIIMVKEMATTVMAGVGVIMETITATTVMVMDMRGDTEITAMETATIVETMKAVTKTEMGINTVMDIIKVKEMVTEMEMLGDTAGVNATIGVIGMATIVEITKIQTTKQKVLSM